MQVRPDDRYDAEVDGYYQQDEGLDSSYDPDEAKDHILEIEQRDNSAFHSIETAPIVHIIDDFFTD